MYAAPHMNTLARTHMDGWINRHGILSLDRIRSIYIDLANLFSRTDEIFSFFPGVERTRRKTWNTYQSGAITFPLKKQLRTKVAQSQHWLKRRRSKMVDHSFLHLLLVFLYVRLAYVIDDGIYSVTKTIPVKEKNRSEIITNCSTFHVHT